MYKIILESTNGSERTRGTFETDQNEISYLIDGFNGLLIANGFVHESIENNILQRAEEINNQLTFISDIEHDNGG